MVVLAPSIVEQTLSPPKLSLLTTYAVKTLYAVGDDLSFVRIPSIFESAFTYNIAPPTFAVESYVTGVNTRFASVPVSPGRNVNSSVFLIMDVLVDLPVVFPLATLTMAVAAVYANTSEYQTTPKTSATTKQPPHDDTGAVVVGPPSDAAGAEIRIPSAVPGLPVFGQVHGNSIVYMHTALP